MHGEPGGGSGSDARQRLLRLASPEAIMDALLPAQDAVYVKDLDGRYLMVKSSGEASCGYTSDELVGRSDAEIFAGELGERLWRSDQQIMAAGEARTAPEPAIVGGQLRTYLSTKAPLRDASGTVVGLVGVSTDATSLSQANEELARREAHLTEAQALTRVGSWEHDVRSGERTWSDEIYRILGRDRAEFDPTVDAVIECVHPGDRERVTAAMNEAMTPGADGSFAFGYTAVRPDGTERVCRCRGRVFFDLDGAPLRIVGAVQDMTDRQPAAERLGRILNSAHEAFVAMNAAGLITEWNRAAEATFGWSREEALGCVLADLVIPPEFRDAQWLGVRRFLESGTGLMLDRPLELTALHRDGREFPVEVTISAMNVDDVWEFHGFARDISDRRTHEAERDRLIRKLSTLARTDELTGLLNRRAWEEQLAREIARSQRDGGHLCVAVLDLDGFKAYNDAHGHQAGDELLRSVAHSWQSKLRATDVLARYGGEEFVVALHAWPMDAALLVIERLRAHIPDQQACSAGLVAWDGKEGAAEVVGRADKALYEAKRAGRNQTVMRP